MLSQHFLNPGQGKDTPQDLVTTAIDKIFEKNLRFHVKYCSCGEIQYLVLSNFLLVLTIFSFCEEN